MKAIITSTCCYLVVLFSGLAAEKISFIPPEPKPAPNIPRLTAADLRPTFYHAGEFSVDAFATTKFKRFDTLFARDNGGGLGLNWFPFRAAGLGVEALSYDTSHSFIDEASAKLLGRLPWDRFAVNFGLGGTFNFEDDRWAVFAEAGPELRFTRNVGIFANIRGVRPIAGPEGEYIGIFAGLRGAF